MPYATYLEDATVEAMRLTLPHQVMVGGVLIRWSGMFSSMSKTGWSLGTTWSNRERVLMDDVLRAGALSGIVVISMIVLTRSTC
jgi:hypothetical protein